MLTTVNHKTEHKHEHHHHVTAVVERDPWMRRLLIIIAVLLALLFLHGHGWAQTSSAPGQDTYDRNNKALRVNVVAGGGTGGGPADVGLSTAASETDAARQKVTSALRLWDQSQAAGSQLVGWRGDTTSGAWVNCKSGCAAAGDTTASATLGALNNALSMALSGEASASFTLPAANNLVGTLTPEVSFDGGTTWVTDALRQDGANTWASSLTVSSTAASYHLLVPGGASNVRVRVSAYTSGTASAVGRSVAQPESLGYWMGIAGSPIPSFVAFVGGSDGTNLRALKTDTSGDLNVIFPSAQHTIIDSATLGTVTVTGTVTANQGGTWTVATNADTSIGGTTAPSKSLTVNGKTNDATPQYQPIPEGPSGRSVIIEGNASGVKVPVDGSGVTQPVSCSNCSGTVTVTGTVTVNAGTGNFNNASVGTNGSAAPGSSTQIGGTDGTNLQPLYLDPCQRGAKTYTAISLTANTQIITGAASKKTYVCEVHLIAAAATNVALVEGTGTVCATGIAGMAGGSTAATGWNLAANGGLVLGNGGFAVAVTATAADNVCILVSAANQISGNIVTVQY